MVRVVERPRLYAMALAGATVAGALVPTELPPALPVVVALAGLARRSRLVVLVAVALLAAALGHRAWSGLEPRPPGPVHGWARLVSDPEGAVRGDLSTVRADARLADGSRVELRATGTAAEALLPLLAGQDVALRGQGRAPPPEAPWLAPRHVRGTVAVEEVLAHRPARGLAGLANAVRRRLAGGAEVLDARRRALLAGLLVGDDRGQTPAAADAFRAAGLGHLLAVSGQNVAFVLAVAGPLLRRFGPTSRVLATVAVLAGFATVTRAEPSVLRAVTMAGLAAVASSLGRPAQGLQVLGLAVAGLVLVDPLIVHAVGFQLSVLASGAILVGAGPLARRLPGPRLLVEPLAVTVAAQAGTAPLLLHTFGSLPVVALPANLLAGPAAGPATAWGLTAGLAAGWSPVGVARLLHVPTDLLVGWIAGVADGAARLPLGSLGAVHVALLVALATGAAGVGRLGPRAARAARGALAVGALAVALHPAVALRLEPQPAEQALGAGGVLWRSGGATVVVVDGRIRPEALLAALRAEGVGSIDVAVARTLGGVPGAEAVVERYRAPLALAPRSGPAGRLEPTVAERAVRVGSLVLEVVPDGADRLVVAADGPDGRLGARQ